jgi:hypothetical protein
MQIRSVGIDLGKTTFHLVALGDNGRVLVKKKFTQRQLITFTANMQCSLIGMEACAGAHFLGRALRAQGHDVKLIPAQFVKPFVKSNKNDFLDAEAIAEAVDRQNMRFVPIKQMTSWICRRFNRGATLIKTAASACLWPRKCFSTYQHLCGRLPHGFQRPKYLIYKGLIGGPDRDRTGDLFHAMEASITWIVENKWLMRRHNRPNRHSRRGLAPN